MECNKLMREALNAMKKPKPTGYTPEEGIGIHINSKTLTAIRKIAKTMPGGIKSKVNKEHLKKRLINEGVSTKEIDLLLGNLLKPTKASHHYDAALSLKQAYDKSPDMANTFDEMLEWLKIPKDILSKPKPKGPAPKVSLQQARREASKNRIKPEYMGQEYDTIIKNFGSSSQYQVMGLTSDAAKSAGKHNHFGGNKTGFLGWYRNTSDTLPDGTDVHVLQEFQSDWAQGVNKSSFPMDYSDFKKLAIVENLDATIAKGMDTMIIPIDRSGSLHGSKDITKMYSELQKGILPKIKKQLADKDLKINVEVVSKADKLTGYKEAKEVVKSKLVDFTTSEIEDFGLSERSYRSMIERMQNKNSIEELHHIVRETSDELADEMYPVFRKAYDMESRTSSQVEDYFKITIEPKFKQPETPRSFMKEYKKSNEIKSVDDVPDDGWIEVDSLAITRENRNMIDDLQGGRDIGHFDEMDVMYLDDGLTISGKLAKHFNSHLVGKAYKDISDEGIVVYSDLSVSTAERLGFTKRGPDGYPENAESYVRQFVIRNQKRPIDLPDDEKVLIEGLDFDTIGEFKASDKINTVANLVPTTDGYWITKDSMLDILDQPYSPTSDLANIVPGFKGDPVKEQVKVRWDMMGMIGALGLASNESKEK